MHRLFNSRSKWMNVLLLVKRLKALWILAENLWKCRAKSVKVFYFFSPLSLLQQTDLEEGISWAKTSRRLWWMSTAWPSICCSSACLVEQQVYLQHLIPPSRLPRPPVSLTIAPDITWTTWTFPKPDARGTFPKTTGWPFSITTIKSEEAFSRWLPTWNTW